MHYRLHTRFLLYKILFSELEQREDGYQNTKHIIYYIASDFLYEGRHRHSQ